MNRTLLAGVITLTAALAMPAVAQPTENPGTTAPAQTESAPSGVQDQTVREQGQAGSPQAGHAAPEQRGGGEWMHRPGEWGKGAPMMHRMWAMRREPQRRCIDRIAWHAARRAYVEAELGLTAQQQPLWDKVQGIARAEQQKARQLCQSLKPREEATVLDRMDQAQQFLSTRLDALKQAKPAVEALYQALTPEQQAIFNHPFRRD